MQITCFVLRLINIFILLVKIVNKIHFTQEISGNSSIGMKLAFFTIGQLKRNSYYRPAVMPAYQVGG